jgi:hypothetical protein
MSEYLYSLAVSWALWAAVAVLLVSLLGYLPLADKVPIVGPYARVARLVAFLTFGLVCALVDRRSADARSEIAQLTRDLSFAQTQIQNIAATAADKARLANASATAALVADMKANTYEQWLALQPARKCDDDDLDSDDVRWLSDIKPRRETGSANRPGGFTFPRLRGFGKETANP